MGANEHSLRVDVGVPARQRDGGTAEVHRTIVDVEVRALLIAAGAEPMELRSRVAAVPVHPSEREALDGNRENATSAALTGRPVGAPSGPVVPNAVRAPVEIDAAASELHAIDAKANRQPDPGLVGAQLKAVDAFRADDHVEQPNGEPSGAHTTDLHPKMALRRLGRDLRPDQRSESQRTDPGGERQPTEDQLRAPAQAQAQVWAREAHQRQQA